MRIGRNPARKLKRNHSHSEVTLATITYIPFLSGYYAQSLDVLRLCLGSLREHTEVPCEVFVFDNGSCEEVRSFLKSELEQGRIDYLFLSKENLGKAGAWNILFEAAPGEIIAFCDSDIFFKPGWLQEHLRIIKSFPNVGMVTGLPIRQQVDVFTQTGLTKAQTDSRIVIERGDFISEGAMAAYCKGVDRDYEAYRQEIAQVEDVRLQIGDVRAFLGACHFQFVAYKSVLKSLLPLRAEILLDGSARAEGSESEFDQKMEPRGLLRLSTQDVYVHHLGNTVTDEWKPWLEQLATKKAGERTKAGNSIVSSWERRFSQNRYVKAILLRLYNYLFRLYSASGASINKRA